MVSLGLSGQTVSDFGSNAIKLIKLKIVLMQSNNAIKFHNTAVKIIKVNFGSNVIKIIILHFALSIFINRI